LKIFTHHTSMSWLY